MQTYDPAKPLIFLHIPKTAGTTVRKAFFDWFGNGLLYHYYNEQEGCPPPRLDLAKTAEDLGGEPLCIFGHFNAARGLGVRSYYPEVHQFITFVRDPFETAVSTYFYVKSDPYRWAEPKTWILDVTLREFLSSAPGGDGVSPFFPVTLTQDNYRDVLSAFFVHVGVTEHMRRSLDTIASKLGFPSPAAEQFLNRSARDEAVPYDLRDEFLSRRPLESAIYRYALELNGIEDRA